MPQTIDDQIEDQALAWLMRTTSGVMTAEQQLALQHWLAESPLHRQAYAEAQQLWAGLDGLRERPIVVDSLAEPIGPSFVTIPLQRPAKPANRPVWQRQFSLAAACLALLAVLLPTAKNALTFWNAEYQTAVGEQQTLNLSDGSSVYVNTASALNTRYSASQRRIELLTGEAEFQVSKDPARPFVVVVDGHEIKALGTDFVVKKSELGVSVSVVESAVQVSQTERSTAEAVVVHAGQQINILPHQLPGPVAEINAKHANTWRLQRLIFESEPLDRVAAEINRYRPGHVFLSHPSLQNLRVSGVFNIQEIDALLAVIGKTLPVKSVSVGERYVVLY